MSQSDANSFARRDALKLLVVPLTALAAQKLLAACTEDEGSGGTQADAGTSSAAGDASAADSALPAPETNTGCTTDAGDVPWASGGTKAMKGGYPDPFASGQASAACALTKAMILGPCYADTLEREDISEGMPGVPMRLSFLVVRADGCTPVEGATVDIWHTRATGVYSAFGPGTTCNPGTEDVTQPKFCRGVQTTDAKGRVDFSSIVPGWYAGRAVHVHFTVRVDGDEYVTSQLFFDDALLDEIEREVDYAARGTRDTRNTQDGILSADDKSPFILDSAKRADGTLHAWKVLALRSSLDEELPSVGGGLPDFGDGGLPDFGDGGLPPGFGDGGFPGFPGGGGLPPLDGGSQP